MCVVSQKETNKGVKRTHLNRVRLGKNSIRTRITELLLGKAAAFECRVNICNFCHCWISSTSSNYRNSRLKIEIKKVFNIWPQKYCYMRLSTIT